MLYKNNLTIEESNFIRDIFRSFGYLSIHSFGGDIDLVDKNGKVLELESEEKDVLDDVITILFKTLGNLQYLPEISTSEDIYTVTKIEIGEFSYWEKDEEGNKLDDDKYEKANLTLWIEVRYSSEIQKEEDP
jgi:hypothetical protein